MSRRIQARLIVLGFVTVFLVGVAVGQHTFGQPKTVLHVVALQWTPEATEADKQKAIDGIKTMAAAIPGIQNIWLSPDRVQPREFHTAFALEFESREAADAYVDHPAHKAWEEIYLPLRAQSRSLQITNR